jgi:hypothetical protein
MTMADLSAVRACLDRPSMTLLDECADALARVSLTEILIEHLAILAEGLHPVGADEHDETVYRLGYIAELLLREYIWASKAPWTTAQKRTYMLNMARLAGFG